MTRSIAASRSADIPTLRGAATGRPVDGVAVASASLTPEPACGPLDLNAVAIAFDAGDGVSSEVRTMMLSGAASARLPSCWTRADARAAGAVANARLKASSRETTSTPHHSGYSSKSARTYNGDDRPGLTIRMERANVP